MAYGKAGLKLGKSGKCKMIWIGLSVAPELSLVIGFRGEKTHGDTDRLCQSHKNRLPETGNIQQ